MADRSFEFNVPKLGALPIPSGATKAERTIDYADTKERGLMLRVSYAGSKTFNVQARNKQGRRKKKALGVFSSTGIGDGITLADARQAARAFKGEYAGGRDVVAEIRGEKEEHGDASTVADIIDSYLELHASKLKSYRSYEGILIGSALRRKKGGKGLVVKEELGWMKFRDVRRRDVQDMLDRIVARGTPYMANRTHEVVGHMFKWAIRRDMDPAVEHNVADLCERQTEAPRERWLTDREIKKLWGVIDDATSKDTALIYRLLLATGQREMEVLGMRWADLDFEKGEWVIPAEQTKSSRTQLVPMSALFLKLLKGREKTSEWVFPRSPHAKRGSSTRLSRSSFANPHRKVVEAAGIDYFRFHDLRKTLTTHLGELGFDEFIGGRILNHAQRGITGRHYNFYGYREEKLHAPEAWGYKLMWLTGQTPPAELVARLMKWGFSARWEDKPWNLAQWSQLGEKVVKLKA